MLLVSHPPGYEIERRYIYEVILREFLGLDFETEAIDGTSVQISAPEDASGRVLIVADVFFQTPRSRWLSPASLPALPLQVVEREAVPRAPGTRQDNLPVLFGTPLSDGTYFQLASHRSYLGVDIFGVGFFLLTRYEELVVGNRDCFGRFSASASLALRAGILERPLLDEYVEILWFSISQLWPRLTRKQRQFSIQPTHDVDRPFAHAFASPWRLLRNCAKDLVSRRQLASALSRAVEYARVKRGSITCDRFNTFDWLMDTVEERNVRSAFYFLCGRTNRKLDADYDITHSRLRQLLSRIHHRGHEIGLHTSFEAFRDKTQTAREYRRLLGVCHEEGITQSTWGGRQHYLRWEVPTTWQAWEDAGLAYDSTLTYADHAGFRCGTCFEFRVFNVLKREKLRLRERPLILMERSIIDKSYMDLGCSEDAYNFASRLKDSCRAVRGTFTFLWHNSSLQTSEEREFFKALLV